MTIDEVEEGRGSICNQLLRSLPQWFGIEEAIVKYVEDVEGMPFFAAFDGDGAIGFLALNLHNEWTAEIHVMAIHPDLHRQGLGKKLQIRAESYLRQNGYEYMTVKTLSSSRKCEEYERTRIFYAAMGFRPLEELKTLWGEASPCLFMVKTL